MVGDSEDFRPHAPPASSPGRVLALEQVHALFAPPVVRVRLDWKALAEFSPVITFRTLQSGVDISSARTTWYLDSRLGREVHYWESEVKPLTVGDVVRNLARMKPERQARIGRLSEVLRADPPPLLVPCYALPDEELLVLDGNHRLAAAALQQIPIRVLAVVIHGPLSHRVLPDLAFWSN